MKKNLKLSKDFFALSLFLSLILTGCYSASKEVKNVQQLYKENGYPVKVRKIQDTDFSVYLKYPAQYKSMSQSTTYSKLLDVVRQVNYKVGQKVNKDDVVMCLSDDNAAYKSAMLQLKNAEAACQRIENLYKENGVSKQDYENTKTQYEVAKEDFRQISEMIEIKAPISGIITQISANVNSDVQPGSPLFTISNQDGYEALFYVLPEEIDLIKTGAQAVIENKGQSVYGTVTEVSMTIDPMVRAFPVKAYFNGECKTLASGMSVDVKVQTYNNPYAIVLTQKEMTRNAEGWSAWIADNGKAYKKELTVYNQSGLDYEIIGGINKGDLLITEGTQRLTDGAYINYEE